ncbi:hypothetical protein [Pseudomonas fluorescens]|uniref:hypothetical protein n=1 Tax=Pseudomonas fluorescens TaxID=294 RepID=UPI001CD5B10E|nr:hypothetical protein [Pseudomonas fluorescens]
MSRYCGGKDVAPIFAAAEHWRETALLRDGSVFSERKLWTLDGMESLETHFINNPDEGQGTYWEKLHDQLQATPPNVRQLAAEMNWLMLLCPSKIKADSKRKTIRKTWEWSNEQLPDSANQWLDDSILTGIGSAGAGYNNYRWRELSYCINFCLAFKRLSIEDRTEILQDGWRFGEWLQAIAESESRQLRHMLVYLLFPDTFERIFSGGERDSVVLAFGGGVGESLLVCLLWRPIRSCSKFGKSSSWCMALATWIFIVPRCLIVGASPTSKLLPRSSRSSMFWTLW